MSTRVYVDEEGGTLTFILINGVRIRAIPLIIPTKIIMVIVTIIILVVCVTNIQRDKLPELVKIETVHTWKGCGLKILVRGRNRRSIRRLRNIDALLLGCKTCFFCMHDGKICFLEVSPSELVTLQDI